MRFNFDLLALFCLIFIHQTHSQNNEVCFSIPLGPPGPPGPTGPSGIGQDCNITEIRKELNSQRDSIMQVLNATNSFTKPLLNANEIREIFNEEWRKQNNCPIGLADGRIPDSAITSSSFYNNNSDYAPQLGRLNNRPSQLTGSSGAWRSKDVSPITNLTCQDAFYTSSSGYQSSYDSRNYRTFSNKLSRDLVQAVRCPPGCQNYNRYSSRINIYGTSHYTDGSSICRAAIHNGKLTDQGGIVIVQRKPRTVFQGTFQHRFNSQSYSSSDGSFHFPSKTFLQWIQVDLETPKLVTGVVTQGRPTSKEEWVQSFQIQYGNSVNNLQTIANNGTDTIFLANTDMYNHVTNMFREPFRARFIRLVPLTWHGGISLRLEYLTC